MKKLDQNNKTLCEGQLTENECLNALKDMKNNESPGWDGLTIEFYKIFWNDIKLYYIKSINYPARAQSPTRNTRIKRHKIRRDFE